MSHVTHTNRTSLNLQVRTFFVSFSLTRAPFLYVILLFSYTDTFNAQRDIKRYFIAAVVIPNSIFFLLFLFLLFFTVHLQCAADASQLVQTQHIIDAKQVFKPKMSLGSWIYCVNLDIPSYCVLFSLRSFFFWLSHSNMTF